MEALNIKAVVVVFIADPPCVAHMVARKTAHVTS
jgi:hypothetical protein